MNELEIFTAALELTETAARSRFLDEACGGRLELRTRIEALLHNVTEGSRCLESPAENMLQVAFDGLITERPGTQIGPYKLLEQIGTGGMGAVYVAAQEEPVRRKVALKVIKPGMDTRQVVARFEAERQALAMMNHPNIAKVLDAGATDAGRPYFVMELVKGAPITEFCDQQKLDTRERLQLFISVCQAVQHAHHKGLIHRDIKPSNVLVEVHDVTPVPKVIDFGVAKAIGQSLTEKTLHTGFGEMVGTPMYMSPEQAGQSSIDVDTRSDIYSLGVLLYEILTGHTPFERDTLRNAGLDEMRRIIREVDPPRPSARVSTLEAKVLSTISDNRKMESRKLSQQLRGELDWIVMKALEKDRNRRYESANALAADAQRYLDDEPVHACPPSATYRFRKFTWRNRVALMTATVLTAALVLGTVVSVWQTFLARKAQQDAVAAWKEESLQRKRAVDAEKLARNNEQKALGEEEKAKRSQALTLAFSDFLVNDILAVARPEGVQGGLGVGVTVAEALEAAEAVLEERFAGRPLAEATARDAIGKTWRNLAKYEQAERQLRRAVELREQELGPDSTETLDSCNSLAYLLTDTGRYAESVVLRREILEKLKAKFGPEHPETFKSMKNLAMAYNYAGKFEEAVSLHEEIKKNWTLKFGPDYPLPLETVRTLADAYLAAGKRDQALQLYEQALVMAKAKFGPDHAETSQATINLALANRTGGPNQALPLFEQALVMTNAKFGPDHPETLLWMNRLALSYIEAGKLDRGLPLLEQALEKAQAKLDPDHPTTLMSMNNLAFAYQAAGKIDEALALNEQTREKTQAKFGADHPNTLISMDNLARSYLKAGHLEKAVALYEETLQKRLTKLGADHPHTFQSMNNLAKAYLDANRLDQAVSLFEQALEGQQAKLGPDHEDTLTCMENLAGAYRDSSRLSDAIPLLEQVLQRRKLKFGTDHRTTLTCMGNLGGMYKIAHRPSEALPLLEQALERRKVTLGPAHPDTLIGMESLAECYSMLGQPEKSEPLRVETAAFWKEKAGADSLKYAGQLAFLALSLLEQKKPAAAESILRECLAIREKAEADVWTTFSTMSMLGESLLGQQNYAEAEPLLLSGYEGLKQREEQIPPQSMVRLTAALERLVLLYDTWKQPDKADEWRKKLPVAKSENPTDTKTTEAR